MDLRHVKHWFLDLDGTVYLGDELLPGARELIETFTAQGVGFTFLTNNSSKSLRDYVAKLKRLGLDIAPQQVFSSARATGAYLRQRHPEAGVFLLGTPALAAELADFGVSIVEENADTVVLGFDTTLSYARLVSACRLIGSGARYIATHPDVNCPSPEGPLPDAGAMISLIETSTGRRPDSIIGKPNLYFLDEAAQQCGVTLSHCAMIGDRLETDMAMARQAGIPAVLVLTGVTRPADLAASPQAKGDGLHVFQGLPELLEALQDPSRPKPEAAPVDARG